MNQQKALLIIDMQKGSFTPTTPRYDTEGVVKRINQLATKFRELDHKIIFIQHDGSAHQEFMPNTPDWELLDGLEVKETDIIVSKTANDAFYKSKLNSLLGLFQIKGLYVTGCATDFCVESTIQAGLSRDYHLTVVADGHTTGDRPHLKAEKVVEHYNWVWQNMIPTKGAVRVKRTKDVLDEIITLGV